MIRQLTKCIREYKAPTIWTLVLILAEVAIDVIIPFETANLINEVKAGAELSGIVRVGLVLVLLAMILQLFQKLGHRRVRDVRRVLQRLLRSSRA